MSRRALIAITLLAFTACGIPEEEPASETSADGLAHRQNLLFRWAPVHYQDVGLTGKFGGRADYLTRVDYDGDWLGRNNWENITSPQARFDAWVYGKVIETSSHYFLYYMFYHPIDWHASGTAGQEHEHDAESVFMLIRKDNTSHGAFQAMITEKHGSKVTASADSRLTSTVPETVTPQWALPLPNESFRRVMTYQEVGGHGIYPCGYNERGLVTRCHLPDESGVKYVPGLVGQSPQGVVAWQETTYGIRDMDELYGKRSLEGRYGDEEINLWSDAPWGTAFGGDDGHECGEAASTTCKTDAAHPVWDGTGNPIALFEGHFRFDAGSAIDPSGLSNAFDNYDCQPGPNEVALFQHENYGGSCVYYPIDPVIGRHTVPNFRNSLTSSVKVGSNVTLLGCTHPLFVPFCARYVGNVANLGNWLNDAMTSFMVVRKDLDCHAGTQPLPGQVIVYDGGGFSGQCAILDRQYGDGRYSHLGLAGFPSDKLSSVKIGPGTSATFYDHQDFTGPARPLGPGNWAAPPGLVNDEVTSVVIH